MFGRRHLFGAGVGLSCSLASLVAAAPLFNTFGPDNDGYDFQYDSGWTIAGDSLPPEYGQQGAQQAFQFTPDTSGKLKDLYVAIYAVPNAPETDEVKFALALDTNGQFPQAADIIEQWTITSFGSPSDWFPPQHLTSVVKPQLNSGTSYWIWMYSTLSTTWCAWNLNPYNGVVLGHTLKRTSDADWRFIFFETAPAIQLNSPSCPGDFNGDGNRTVQDIFDFLTAFFSGQPNADFNHSGSITPQDVFDFLSAWFAGC